MAFIARRDSAGCSRITGIPIPRFAAVTMVVRVIPEFVVTMTSVTGICLSQ